MRKYLLLALLIALLAMPLAVSAQSDVVIDDLQLEFWPEYDEPAMLVIYRVQLAADTALPVELSFTIPAASGGPFAVAVGSDTGLVNADYDTDVDGDVMTVTFTTDSTLAQFEYYDPNLVIDGQARNYEFATTLDYPVTSLAMRVQQPVGASNLVINPDLGSGEIGGDGLTYYTATLGEVPAGEPVGLSVSYQKSTDALSISAFENTIDAEEAPSTAAAAGAGIDWTRWLVYALLVFGLGLIGFGAYSTWQNQQPAKRKRGSRRRGRPASGGKPARSSGGAAVFCHECGTQAQAGDKFCRECGTALRK